MGFRFIKPVQRVLLSTALLSLGFWSSPVYAQASDAQVSALVEALRLAAPQTGRADDGLYSDWQIKPGNIPRWSKQCIGRELSPTDFEASPVTARAILVCVMRDVLNEQFRASNNNESVAIQRAAAWWMTGDGSQYNSIPENSYTYTYIQNVLKNYQQQRRNPQTQQSATPAQPTPTPSAAKPASSSPPTESQSSAASQPQAAARSSANNAISDTKVAALVEALRRAAPQTGIENDGLYSDWQIKPENIPRWSNQCIGEELTPADFAASPATARTILVCVMGDVFNEQYEASGNNETVAVQRAAAWWMTGDPQQYNQGSTADYTQRVLNFYRQSFLKLFPHL
ncbi:MAG: hypothetical protein RID53_01650 [Coleofasciculus sp. B1-GNL1-01]|uniref:hypothetical protein n=1 Tax=Coleofasciculus sp. B1-GNL1-01 TaxID=3068484 RepID=UPI0032FA9924